MLNVNDLLQAKGHSVWSVDPETTVFEALELMADKDVGALLVLEEALSGITEYWQIILGPLLLLVVLFARGGIDGLLEGWRRG